MGPLQRFLSRFSRPPRLDVSVIMATLNARGLIRPSVESVLAQTGVSSELVICDGGSTDGTVEEIQASCPQAVVRSGPDRGLYEALNKALRLAKGRFILILGAGDRLRPDALRTLLAHAAPGDCNLVYGDVYMEDRSTRYGGPWEAERFRRDNLCQQGILYGRGIFRLLGDFDLKYPILADYAFNIKCFGHPLIRQKHVDALVADYLGNGISANNRDEAFLNDRPELLEHWLGLPRRKPRQQIRAGTPAA